MWAGSWLLRREEYSPDRSFGQRLEIIDYQRDRSHLRGEDALTRNRSTQLRVVMTTRRRLFFCYTISACRLGGMMVLQLVLVGDGVCRFPPGLG